MGQMPEKIKKMEDFLADCSELELAGLDRDETAVAVVDMVKGFAEEGPLSSPRIAKVMADIVSILEKADGYHKLFIRDEHPEDAVEFLAFPGHCIRGTAETDFLDDLKPFIREKDSIVIAKNSTNAFHAPDFAKWFAEHGEIRNFVLTGDCTDICILQFALTLKSYFNEKNIPSRIIVPVRSVETYENEETAHYGDLINLMSFYIMKISGVEIVDTVR